MGTVTIQKTSKGLKLQRVLAGLLVLAGVITMASSFELGGFMVFSGIVWGMVVKLSTWWNHG